MRIISGELISGAVADMCVEANCVLPESGRIMLREAIKSESTALAKSALEDLATNASIAETHRIPLCQDTGTAVFFIKMGHRVAVSESLNAAINRGVAMGYARGLRASMHDPLTGENTGNNSPALIYTELVEGDILEISMMPKGGGAENMSRVKMLAPHEGIKGIKNFVIETVSMADANPCPPLIIGVGIGGSMEKSALMAKEALLRTAPHHLPSTAALENELKAAVNALGIGPAGFGGDTTCMGLFIETMPCHIASLPVAVNLGCHATRHIKISL